MIERNRYIILLGALTGCVSCIYFLSLLAPVPLFVTGSLMLACAGSLSWWVMRDATEHTTNAKKYSNKSEWLGIGLLAVAILCLTITGASVAGKYGGWDAKGIWNLDARYLADPLNWRKLFLDRQFAHPDYPLCLPATIAFFLRLTSSPDSYLIPFIFSMVIALCIPALIYGELWPKSRWAAVVILVFFVLEIAYIINSTLQYADMLVGFFLLCAVVCFDNTHNDKRNLALGAFFTGCCMWTKNEGILLAAVVFAFYRKQLFSRQAIRYTLPALGVPLVTLVVFKTICPVQNDLLSSLNGDMVQSMVSKDRYKMILTFFTEITNKRLIYSRIPVAIAVVFLLVKRKRPVKEMLLVVCCTAVYFGVYLVTPKDLAWHLTTSGERLLFQLFPVLMYATGKELAQIKISFPARKSVAVAQKPPVTAPITNTNKRPKHDKKRT